MQLRSRNSGHRPPLVPRAAPGPGRWRRCARSKVFYQPTNTGALLGCRSLPANARAYSGHVVAKHQDDAHTRRRWAGAGRVFRLVEVRALPLALPRRRSQGSRMTACSSYYTKLRRADLPKPNTRDLVLLPGYPG